MGDQDNQKHCLEMKSISHLQFHLPQALVYLHSQLQSPCLRLLRVAKKRALHLYEDDFGEREVNYKSSPEAMPPRTDQKM
ncbi:hypothetical protein LWI29_013017 [Acer saccharum]|uniref:Uncharacterized protein n=1 Tax=Acer saccharum TaxID=4024 RepID=A0AA39VRM8_ACESA|nr:hypothetical protein LWI29_013017 [Acer saccharum]